MIDSRGLPTLIEVDGVNHNAWRFVVAGAHALVSGSGGIQFPINRSH